MIVYKNLKSEYKRGHKTKTQDDVTYVGESHSRNKLY